MARFTIGCEAHRCDKGATHRIGVTGDHPRMDESDRRPRFVCNHHLAVELDIWAEVVASAQPDTIGYYVTYPGTSVVISPVVA